MSLTPDQIEQRSVEAGLTAPRVTVEDVRASIAHVEYVKHVAPSGQVLRWCVLTAKNGHAVSGRPSAAVSAANDNEALGQQRAYDNAFSELWGHLGFSLKETLYQESIRG